MKTKPSKKFWKPLDKMDWEIGVRILYRRKIARLSRAEVATKIGLTPHQLANIEAGRVPLKLKAGWEACKLFNIHPDCLATEGYGRAFPANHPNIPRLEPAVIGACAESSFSKSWGSLSWILNTPGKKDDPNTSATTKPQKMPQRG